MNGRAMSAATYASSGVDFFDEASGRCQRIENQVDAIAAYPAGLHPG